MPTSEYAPGDSPSRYLALDDKYEPTDYVTFSRHGDGVVVTVIEDNSLREVVLSNEQVETLALWLQEIPARPINGGYML